MEYFSIVRTILVTGWRRLLLKIRCDQRRYGYIGGHQSDNLGDEVMFSLLANLLKPSCLVTLETPRIEEYLSVVGLSGRKYFYKYILGGGTLINPIWWGKTERLSKMGVKIISIGTGVGNCGREQIGDVDIFGWAETLGRFESVFVRGPLSLKRLQEIGVRAEISGDVGLAMGWDFKIESNQTEVAVNLLSGDPLTKRGVAVLQSLIPLFKANGLNVTAWVVNPSDAETTHREIGKLVDSVRLVANEEDLAKAAENLRFTVCMRLHGSVFSTAFSIPTIMLGYRDKCLDFMESIEMEDYYVDLEAPDYISRATIAAHNLLDDALLNEVNENLSRSITSLRDRLSNALSVVRS